MSKNNWGGDPNAEINFRDPVKGESLEAGRYLVIDPCYVFGDPDSLWDRVCDALYHDDKDKGRIVMLVATPEGDHKVYIWNTAYGDGVYPVFDEGVEQGGCGVDAGLLCFIPEALIEEIEGNDSLGTWVTLKEAAPIHDNDEGDVQVGPIHVCTCGCMVEDEPEDVCIYCGDPDCDGGCDEGEDDEPEYEESPDSYHEEP